ncbi:MAG: response regulator [Spirochaetales bacterium]|nr:response regulator [Spirochaetales bacterium]
MDKKILIVEDEILIAYQIKITLIQKGYTKVDVVHSKKAAIEYSRDNGPEIIFMDIAMEYETAGIDACVEIKRILGDSVKIYFLTSYSQDSFMALLQNVSYDGFIDKLQISVVLQQVLAENGNF